MSSIIQTTTFGKSVTATADVVSVAEGTIYNLTVPDIYRKFTERTGGGTTLLTGTFSYNSPAELTGKGDAISTLLGGRLLITFYDKNTLQATGEFKTDESDFTTVATSINNGMWDSTTPPAPPFPNITLAIVTGKTVTLPGKPSNAGGSKDIYNLSAPLISKTFSEKVDQGVPIAGTFVYTSTSELMGEQSAVVSTVNNKLTISFKNDGSDNPTGITSIGVPVWQAHLTYPSHVLCRSRAGTDTVTGATVPDTTKGTWT